MELFKQLSQFMCQGEKLHLEIERKGKSNSFKVLLVPVLGKEDENLPEELQQLRAALACPVFLSGTATDLDTAFSDKISKASEQRHLTQGTFEELLDIHKESRKKASASVKTKTPKSVVTKQADEGDDDEVPRPEGAAASEQGSDTSLFETE